MRQLEEEEDKEVPHLEIDFREFVPSLGDSVSDYRNKDSDYRPSKESIGFAHPTTYHIPFRSEDSTWNNLETISAASHAKKLIQQRAFDQRTPSCTNVMSEESICNFDQQNQINQTPQSILNRISSSNPSQTRPPMNSLQNNLIYEIEEESKCHGSSQSENSPGSYEGTQAETPGMSGSLIQNEEVSRMLVQHLIENPQSLDQSRSTLPFLSQLSKAQK